MKRIFITVPLCLFLSLAVTAQRSMPQAMQKLLNAEYAIASLYVDSVSEDKLVEDAIKGMLENLDPHSSYTDAKETKELEEPLQGEFSGVGIQFNMNIRSTSFRPSPAVPASAWECWRETASSMSTTRPLRA